jgi:hypothetical protein
MAELEATWSHIVGTLRDFGMAWTQLVAACSDGSSRLMRSMVAKGDLLGMQQQPRSCANCGAGVVEHAFEFRPLSQKWRMLICQGCGPIEVVDNSFDQMVVLDEVATDASSVTVRLNITNPYLFPLPFSCVTTIREFGESESSHGWSNTWVDGASAQKLEVKNSGRSTETRAGVQYLSVGLAFGAQIGLFRRLIYLPDPEKAGLRDDRELTL